MPLVPLDAPPPLDTPPRPSGRWAALCMFLANVIGILSLVELIPAEPANVRKVVLAVSLLLSTYGFRSALSSEPPRKDK